jgi:crossover junction endodeoxyribonuclease RuvC
MNKIKNLGEKTILSIDPGYERLGMAILKKDTGGKIQLLHSECFKTLATENFADRLIQIGTHIQKIIQENKPTCLSIESLFLQNNQKTVMKVSETKGVIMYIAKINGLSVFEFTPLQIKSAVTGSGKSDKTSVQKMVILQVPEVKHKDKMLDDEYDAIACGLTYFALEKSL